MMICFFFLLAPFHNEQKFIANSSGSLRLPRLPSDNRVSQKRLEANWNVSVSDVDVVVREVDDVSIPESIACRRLSRR